MAISGQPDQADEPVALGVKVRSRRHRPSVRTEPDAEHVAAVTAGVIELVAAENDALDEPCLADVPAMVAEIVARFPGQPVRSLTEVEWGGVWFRHSRPAGTWVDL